MTDDDKAALDIAKRFHNLYESLAPQYGYVTRADTKVFDPDSPNGKLMIEVCRQMLAHAETQHAERVKALVELLQRIYQWDGMDAMSDGQYWRAEIDRVTSR